MPGKALSVRQSQEALRRSGGAAAVSNLGPTSQVQQIEAVASGRNWLVNGGIQTRQRGSGPFTSATTPANNDDTYLFDGFYLLSDGNDIADFDVSSPHTDFVTGQQLKIDIETANKKLGFVWPVEELNGAEIRRFGVASAQVKAKQLSGTSIGALRLHIMGWTGPFGNVITSDMVSAWNAAGADFTPVANWEIVGTGTLTLTDTIQTCVINGVAVSSSMLNFAVFVVLDDTTMDVGDTLAIGDVKLEAGPAATPFVPLSIQEAILASRRTFWRANQEAAADYVFGHGQAISSTKARIFLQLPAFMRLAPTFAKSAAGDFALTDAAGAAVAVTDLTLVKACRDRVYLEATVAAGLTAGDAVFLVDDGNGLSWIDLSAEL